MSIFDDPNDSPDTSNKAGDTDAAQNSVKIVSAIIGIVNVVGAISGIKKVGDSIKSDKEYEKSEEYKRDLAEINRLEIIVFILIFIFVVLNLAIIGWTIFCVWSATLLCFNGCILLIKYLEKQFDFFEKRE